MQVWAQVAQADPRISGARLDGSPCGMRALPSPSPSKDIIVLPACDSATGMRQEALYASGRLKDPNESIALVET